MRCSRLLALCLCVASAASLSINYTVPENVAIGTEVGSIPADGYLRGNYTQAELDLMQYSLVGDNNGLPYFRLDPNSGALTTKTLLDREEICSYETSCELLVTGTIDPVPGGRIIIVNIRVIVEDENDNSPAFSATSITIPVPESLNVGSMIPLPTATDYDLAAYGIQDYVLLSSSAPSVFNFVVNRPTSTRLIPQLELMESLDAESVMEYSLVLSAIDGGVPALTGTASITITVTDANDYPVEMDDEYTANVPENLSINSSVILVQATDGDVGRYGEITYSLLPDQRSPQSVHMFDINPRTGQIYLTSSLDREDVAVHLLRVEAVDGPDGQPVVADVTITVNDINDNAPTITLNTPGQQQMQVAENEPRGRVIAIIFPNDADAEDNAQVSCEVSGNDFYLERIDDVSHNFRVLTNRQFDRELESERTLEVYCYDGGNPSLSVTEVYTVHILDANDHPPTFSKDSYSGEVEENANSNTYVLTVSAEDIDQDQNGDVTYAIEGLDSIYFRIDAQSGVIRTTHVFDYESHNAYGFRVLARDKGAPVHTATASVYVTVGDVNDHPPVFSKNVYDFRVQENQPNRTVAGLVSASDEDTGSFAEFVYSLSATDDFVIDMHSGEVMITKPLDREQQAVHELTVYAVNTDTSSTPQRGEARVLVHLVDKNDNWPVISYPNQKNKTVYISSLAPSGYEVLTVEASDDDEGLNADLVYSLTGGINQDLFYVDYNTGVISTVVSMQDYKDEVLQVIIGVADRGIPVHLSTAEVEVRVNDTVAFYRQPDTSEQKDDALLQGTHLNIVIAMAVVSTVIVVILVVAIILVKRQDRAKKTNEAQRQKMAMMHQFTAAANGDRNNEENASNNNTNCTQQMVWSSDVKNSRLGFTPAHLAAAQAGGVDLSSAPGASDRGRSTSGSDTYGYGSHVGRSQSFQIVPSHNASSPYKPIGRASIKYEGNGRVAVNNQKDSDSSCSNDSGRGQSEEGEHSTAIGPAMGPHSSPRTYQQPSSHRHPSISTATYVKHPPQQRTHNAPPTVDTYGQDPHKHPQQQHPQQHLPYGPCPDHLKTQGSMKAKRAAPPPVPPPKPQHYPHIGANSIYANPNSDRQHNANSNINNCNRPLGYSSHDDLYGDNASTTSGSYFVNLHDFDDEDYLATKSVDV